jgi:2-dehydropantoate 2-reductase
VQHTEGQSQISEFLILGAGALGSIIAAHLARSGHQVTVLARGQRAQDIEHFGLRIVGLADFSQRVRVLTEPSLLRAARVLIVATKTPGTEAALAPLRGMTVDAALSIQNGLKKNELLAECFGQKAVLGCLANVSGELLPSGEVMFTRNANIRLGELDGGFSTRSKQIASVIDSSGLRCEAVADIKSLEWSKFAAWVGMMVLSVMTRVETWKYMTDSGSVLLLARLVREMGKLARAYHVQLSDDSVLPVATICRLSEPRAVSAIRQVGLRLQSDAPRHRMSTLQDLEAGRPLEVEETLGYAVQLAQQSNLRLPLLSSLYPLVAAIDRIRAEAV